MESSEDFIGDEISNHFQTKDDQSRSISPSKKLQKIKGFKINSNHQTGFISRNLSVKKMETYTIAECAYDMDNIEEMIGSPLLLRDCSMNNIEKPKTEENIFGPNLINKNVSDISTNCTESNPLRIGANFSQDALNGSFRNISISKAKSFMSIPRVQNQDLKKENCTLTQILNEMIHGIVTINSKNSIEYINKYLYDVLLGNNNVTFNELHDGLSAFKFVNFSLRTNDPMEIKTHTYAGDDEEDDPYLKQSIDEIPVDLYEDKPLLKLQNIRNLQDLLGFYFNNLDTCHINQTYVSVFQTKIRNKISNEQIIVRVRASIIRDLNGKNLLVLAFQELNHPSKKSLVTNHEELNESNLINYFGKKTQNILDKNVSYLQRMVESFETYTGLKETLIKDMLTSNKLMSFSIDNMLCYFQTINNDLKLKIEPQNLAQTISSCLELFQNEIDEKNLILNVYIDKEVPVIFYTDHNRIKQILVNLLSNSLKYTVNGGISVLLKHTQSGSVVFSVEDDGVGMENDTQEKLKKSLLEDRFNYNLKSHSSELGLGLFISNKLVQSLNMKGRDLTNLNLESARTDKKDGLAFLSERNQGSNFYFEIDDFPPVMGKDLRSIVQTNLLGESEEGKSSDSFNTYTTKPFRNIFQTPKNPIQDSSPMVSINENNISSPLDHDDLLKSFPISIEKTANVQDVLVKLRRNL